MCASCARSEISETRHRRADDIDEWPEAETKGLLSWRPFLALPLFLIAALLALLGIFTVWVLFIAAAVYFGTGMAVLTAESKIGTVVAASAGGCLLLLALAGGGGCVICR